MFHALPAPTALDLQAIAQDIVRRATRLLEKRGLCWDSATAAAQGIEVADPWPQQQPLLAECCAQSMQGVVTLGPRRGQLLAGGPKVARLQVPKDLRRQDPRAAEVSGLNIHAGVRVSACERKALARLLRYVLRPPIASERLSWTRRRPAVLPPQTPLRRRTRRCLL